MILFIIVNLGSSGTFVIILHVADRSVAMGLSLVRIEVATAGQKGLNINDPTARLQLRHLPNPSPSQPLRPPVCSLWGVKLLMPGEEAGFDFERKFEVARGVVGGETG